MFVNVVCSLKPLDLLTSLEIVYRNYLQSVCWEKGEMGWDGKTAHDVSVFPFVFRPKTVTQCGCFTVFYTPSQQASYGPVEKENGTLFKIYIYIYKEHDNRNKTLVSVAD